MKKIYILLSLLLVLITSCTMTNDYVKINNSEKITIKIGETVQLNVTTSESLIGTPIYSSENDIINIDEKGFITALKIGITKAYVNVGDYQDSIIVEVIENNDISITLTSYQKYISVGDCLELNATVSNQNYQNEVEYLIKDGDIYATLDGNILTGVEKGLVTVVAKVNDIYSNTLLIEIVDNTTVHSIKLFASKYYIKAGEISTLDVEVYPKVENVEVKYEIVNVKYYTTLNNNIVTGKYAGGTTTFVAKIGDVISNEITISVVNDGEIPESINLTVGKNNLPVGEATYLSIATTPYNAIKNVEYRIISGFDVVDVYENIVKAKNFGKAQIQAIIEGVESNIIDITVNTNSSDPYLDVSEEEFYYNYSVATSYLDSYYRTLHNFMSGLIEPQDQKPTISSYQPQENGVLYRNSHIEYSADMNTYTVLDAYGNEAFEVYRGGAYISLEEVAAYLFAFGDIPINYSSKKSTEPTESVWGKYLRVNHTSFSGSSSKYPYEPALPNISGNGGELKYYEVDLGTTGTDCDPSYDIKVYNDGKEITRGAARIVYTRYDKDKNEIIDPNEKYLFYTYNNYNDFQEYLNYEGGWGYMFGNITGGGTLSSKYDYNPTPYIPTILKDFTIYSSKF